MRLDIRPLRCEADYDWALAEIAPYFEKEPARGTAAADRFDVLAALIAEYEARHWPIEPPDPVAAIRARMEQAGYTQADLARCWDRGRLRRRSWRGGGVLRWSRHAGCTRRGGFRRRR